MYLFNHPRFVNKIPIQLNYYEKFESINIWLCMLGLIADVLQNCFKTCNCHYLPKHNVSRINCSKRNLKDLNETTSVSEITPLSVELILKDNLIEIQPNLTNFDNIIFLDIGNNSITRMDANLLPKSLKVKILVATMKSMELICNK